MIVNDLDTYSIMIERLRAYADALDLKSDDELVFTALDTGKNTGEALALLREKLSTRVGGDFLAYRLHRYFAAMETDFRGPLFARQRLVTAALTLK